MPPLVALDQYLDSLQTFEHVQCRINLRRDMYHLEVR